MNTKFFGKPRMAAACLLATVLVVGSGSALAALTDLANAPLTNGGSIQVKPNIMLLLDTSNSMRRTHMPDELETTATTLSLGYKAYQCNILYYNPTQRYQVPKQADGSAFATPSFGSAPYNGFDSASANVDLASAFQAYDNATRQNAVGADPSQAAYYYLHSSGQSFTPNAAPCTDADTNVSKAATTSPTGVTGNWTRVLVSATSGPGATDERQNFAIWYSFYRTRINLAKSAISLAFTPLTDSYRVGFITVLPNVALTGTGSVDSAYYLPISDFNATQRTNWFNKLFTQTPRGSSPARQGLARVGRHFAGQIDGINDGMPEDPIQYSCQQNFTIATTDGYWNVGAETSGPVRIDGTTLVGQQDGTLTDASGNTPRPIWDGEINNTRISTDKNNSYSYAACTSSWFQRSTSQINRSTTQTLRSTAQIRQSTNQNLQTSVQIIQSTNQNRRSTTQITQSTAQDRSSTIQRLRSTNQNRQSTLQTRRSTHQDLQSTNQVRMTSAQVTQSTSQAIRRETRRFRRVDQIQRTSSQVVRSTTQMLQSTTQTQRSTFQNLQSTNQDLLTRVQVTQSTSQITRSTFQNLVSTSQDRETSVQLVRGTSQNQQSTVQNRQSTTQDVRSTSQNTKTETQVRRSTLQILSCSSITELCTPVASCTPSGTITCQNVTTGPTLVASCTAAAAALLNSYTATTCTPTVVGPTAVSSCSPIAPVSGNNFTTTTCNTVVTGPTPVQTCTAAAAASGNSWTTTTCATNTTGPTPIQTCTPVSESSGNNWTTTSCSNNNTSNVPVQTCTASAATSGNSWTTTTCNVATTSTGVQTCTPSAATSGNSWTTTTCTNPGATNYTNQPVNTCTPQIGGSGNQWRTITCNTATTGPTAAFSCTPSSGTSGNSWVDTTCTTNNTGPTGVSSCMVVVPTSGNNWTSTACGTNNTGPTGVASCTPVTAASGNSWTTTTCGNNNITNSPVQTCTPQTGAAGNGYATITCSVATTGPTPVQTCTAVAESSGNNWTQTTCGTNNSLNQPVSSCTASAATSGNGWVTTTCTPNNTSNVPVSSCTAAAAAMGNNWTTTTCTPNNTSNVPVASCAASGASSGNSWTTTTCANPGATNFTNQPAGSCTAQSPNAGNNYITITCNSAVITAPTVVDPASCPVGNTLGGGPNFYSTTCYDTVTDVPAGTCTPAAATMGNGWVAVTCPGPITTGPTPVQTCTPQTGAAGNNWITITCANPPATNFTNQPAASCTAQTASAGNNWTTISCPAPVTTGPTPIQTCTPVAAAAGNAFTQTTCSTATSGPTPVDPATCALGAGRSTVTTPGTAGNNWVDVTCAANDTTNVPVATCTVVTTPVSGNNWTTTSCPAPVVTTNVPVASCSAAAAASGNSWTTTTCPTPVTSGPTPVSSCTPVAPVSGNNFVETTCSTNNTGPTGVSSCTPVAEAAGNAWTTTTCGTNNTTNVAVASCTPSAPSAGNSWVTTTCPAPVTTGPTAVGSCTPQTAASGNSWVTRTCDTSNTNNYANRPVASCTPQTAASGNSFIGITCPAAIVTTNVPVASCSAATAAMGNNWTTTTCNTVNTGPTAVAPASCTAAPASSANSFTTTTCALNNTGPTPIASCTAAAPVSGNSFTTTTCDTVTTGPTLTQSCTAASAAAGNLFTTTTCPLAPGQKVQYTTTTSVTTTQFSGGLAVGPPTVSSSTGTATDIDGACFIAGVDSLPPVPNPGKPGTIWTYNAPTTGTSTNVTLAPAPTAPCTSWACITNSNALAGGVANSLADVAQYYYVTDLRPTLQNNVPTTGSGPEDDRATHQHMTTFTIGLGVSGALNYRNDYRSFSTTTGDFAEIRAGTKNWTYPEADQPTSIDDFWHAAVNGRGQYFSAGSPTSVIQGLSSALAGVTARTGSGSAAAPSSQAPVDGDNLTFIAKYVTQKWTGELEAREIELSTGAPKNTVVWSGAAKLATKVGNFCDNRQIYLYRQGATNNMVNFTWGTQACDSGGAPTGTSGTGLNSTEQGYFDSTRVSLLSQYLSMTDGSSGTVNQRSAAVGSALVNYIRGQRGNEDFVTNTANRLYRKRDTILGDITNSAPRYVRGATADYADAGYEAFAATSASRTPMVYVASNGGMLHAFRAGADKNDTNGGNEAWAFIPTQVLPNLYRLADNNYANNHIYTVDGTPIPSDVYDSTASAWKKILVAGLNGGGKGYYALDVSDPANPKALWEFNWSNTCYDGTSATAGADCYLGYTYGKPIYGKLNDGTWVVMVTSGYNNVNSPTKSGDGQGYLYVLNAITGKIIYRISTGYGDATSPSGLGQIALFADDPKVSLTALQVYGADLAGNIWRFDVNDRITPSGREAALVAVAKASDGTRQPITTTPRLLETDGKAFIVVGTGRLLGTSDITDNQTQSIYAFRDELGSTIANLRSNLAPLIQTQTGANDDAAGFRTIACQSGNTLCGTPAGWYSDMPVAGERVVVDPQLQLGTLQVATSIMSSSACNVGGIGKLINLNALTGDPIPGQNNRISQGYLPSLPVGITVLKLPGGAIVSVVADSTGANNAFPFPVVQPGPQGKRITWRELTQ